MREVIRMSCVLAMLGVSPAYAFDHIRAHVPDAQTVGKGRMSVLFWDVYDAELFAPKGTYITQKPFALSLTYLRDLDGQDIADRSVEEIRNLGFHDELKLATWHTQMKNIFPDVTHGTVLTGVYNSEGVSIFFNGDKEIGRIRDKEFGLYFFNIWLDRNSSAPDLRSKLLGE
jgi:hypothetical protein